jgi:hypothetical protein
MPRPELALRPESLAAPERSTGIVIPFLGGS